MRWLVLAAFSFTFIFMGCGDPGEDLVDAREAWREAQEERDRRIAEAERRLSEERQELTEAQKRLQEIIREGETEVRDAQQKLEEARTEAARAHMEAQQELRRDLKTQMARIQKLRQEASVQSPELQERLEAFLRPVGKNLTDAENRIMAFEEYTYPDWKDLKESAARSIERLRESIDLAEQYDDLSIPVPRTVPSPTPAAPETT